MKYHSSNLRRTLYDPNICDIDVYLKIGRIVKEITPYEGRLDALLHVVKNEELNPKFDLSLLQVCFFPS